MRLIIKDRGMLEMSGEVFWGKWGLRGRYLVGRGDRWERYSNIEIWVREGRIKKKYSMVLGGSEVVDCL